MTSYFQDGGDDIIASAGYLFCSVCLD